MNDQQQSQSTQNQPGSGGNREPGTQGQSQQTSQGNQPNGSIFSQAGLEEPGTKGSTVWPDDWRLQFAGGDEKIAKQLERYTDPTKVASAFMGLRQRISTGEFRSNSPRPTGDGVKPEQVEAWKTERGLPAKVDDYKFPLGANIKMEDLPEAAKGRVAEFTKAFFDADLSQAQVDHLMGVYNARAEADAEAQANADATARDDTEDQLRAQFGTEYKSMVASTKAFLAKNFGDDAEGVALARLPDGRRLMDIPAVAKAFAQIARDSGMDPVETGESQVGGGKSVDQRIEEIRGIMQTDRGRYYKEKLDEEYSALLARKGMK